MTELVYCPSSSAEELGSHKLPQYGCVGFSRGSNQASECKL
jgi:hypothetical protein